MVIITTILIYLFIQKINAEPTDTKTTCPELWVEATKVGMGCLLFNTTTGYSWEDAYSYCQQENSTLLEIQFQEQFYFLTVYLDSLGDNEGVGYNWWVGGTDLGKEGRWIWLGSLSPVPEFLWQSGYPRNDSKLNCLMFEDAWNYAGYDYRCRYHAMPICQKNNRTIT